MKEDDTIKRSDAIKIMACEMYAEAQSQGYEVDSIEDFMPEAKAWMNDAPSADRPQGRYIDADALVTVCLYDDEHEERYTEYMSVGKCLDLLTEEGCPKTADTPQEDWIPCSERMPDKSGEYLAYSIISFVPDHIGDPNIRRDTTVAFYSRTFNEWIGSGVERVLAWQPKPEPWKGADDE